MKASKTIITIIVVGTLLGLLLGTACSSEGPAGVGIESTIDNGDGTFTLNYTDGTSFTTSNLTGPQGAAGGSMAWKGTWAISTSYLEDDAVEKNGSSYICVEGHTSSAGDEPGVGDSWETYWDLVAQVGSDGADGTNGVDGTIGLAGPPGPNMIVAMGTIYEEGDIFCGYNIDDCMWNFGLRYYEITLTGVSYQESNFVTIVTPEAYKLIDTASYSSKDGKLLVLLYNNGLLIPGDFSFMVLKTP